MTIFFASVCQGWPDKRNDFIYNCICFQTKKKYPVDRIAQLKSDPDGFSDLFQHQHFLYVLRNSRGDLYIHSHFNAGTQKVSLLCLIEQRVPLLHLNCLDSVKMEKKYHTWNIFILLCIYSPHWAAGLNSLCKDAVQLFP